MEPERGIILSSEHADAVNNKNAKAQTHFLVMPKINIESIFKLQYSHLPLLEDMLRLADRVIQNQDLKKEDFLFGFKMDARFQGLAMHVVSKDFISDQLLTKRQWNSFHTRIFMTYQVTYISLKTTGIINPMKPAQLEAMFELPLHCNQCDFETTSICLLKVHLAKHWQKKTQLNTEAPKPETDDMQAKLGTEPVLCSSTTPSLRTSELISLDEMLRKLSIKQKELVANKAPQNLEPTEVNSGSSNLNLNPYNWNKNHGPRYQQPQRKILPPQSPHEKTQFFPQSSGNWKKFPRNHWPPRSQSQSYRYQQPHRYQQPNHFYYQQRGPHIRGHRQPQSPTVNRSIIQHNANANNPITQINDQCQVQPSSIKDENINPEMPPINANYNPNFEKSKPKYQKYRKQQKPF